MRNLFITVFFFFSFSTSSQAQTLSPIGEANQISQMGQGIMSHQVYLARSADGLNWELDKKLIRDHASVPDLVRKKDGTLYLYFVDATVHAIGVGVSQDDGKTWRFEQTTFDGELKHHYVDPNPVLLDDGRIRLYYLANFGPPQPGKVNEVHSATSRDGLAFQADKGFRVRRDDITDPDVIKTKSGWKLIASQGQTAISASGPDGLNFEWDDYPVSVSGAVSRTMAINGGYRLYKCWHGGIRSQVSPDFVSWTEEGVRISMEAAGGGVCDPGLVQLGDGSYLMTYKKMPPPEHNRLPQNVVPLPPGKMPLYNEQPR